MEYIIDPNFIRDNKNWTLTDTDLNIQTIPIDNYLKKYQAVMKFLKFEVIECNSCSPARLKEMVDKHQWDTVIFVRHKIP